MHTNTKSQFIGLASAAAIGFISLMVASSDASLADQSGCGSGAAIDKSCSGVATTPAAQTPAAQTPAAQGTNAKAVWSGRKGSDTSKEASSSSSFTDDQFLTIINRNRSEVSEIVAEGTATKLVRRGEEYFEEVFQDGVPLRLPIQKEEWQVKVLKYTTTVTVVRTTNERDVFSRKNGLWVTTNTVEVTESTTTTTTGAPDVVSDHNNDAAAWDGNEERGGAVDRDDSLGNEKDDKEPASSEPDPID